MENSNLLTNSNSNSKHENNSKSHKGVSQGVAARLINETAKFFGLRPIVYDTLKTAIEPEETEAEREERKWQQRRFRHLHSQYGVRVDAVAAELHRSHNGSETLFDDAYSGVGELLEEGESQRLTSGLESHLPPPLSATFHPTFLTAFRPRSTDSGGDWRQHSQQHPAAPPQPLTPAGLGGTPTTGRESRQSVARMALHTIGSILNGRAFKHRAGTSLKRSSSLTVPTTLSRRHNDENIDDAALRHRRHLGNTTAPLISHYHHYQNGADELLDANRTVWARRAATAATAVLTSSSVTTDDLFFDVSPRGSGDAIVVQWATTPPDDNGNGGGDGMPSSSAVLAEPRFIIIDELPEKGEVNEAAPLRHKSKVDHAKTLPTRTLPIYGAIDPAVASQLRDESFDYRPFFTFWVTTVQVAVMAMMLLRYGVGTNFTLGNFFGVVERSGDVTSTFLSMSHIVVWEQNNVWIGPRFADLVHAGAKYTPCMRQDVSIHAQILAERREEAATTGCCIGAEGGCFQGSECPKQFARLVMWSNVSTSVDTVEGADVLAALGTTRIVCGQDPRYCQRPKSVPPFEWSRTDISKWPICEEPRLPALIPRREEHMHCAITGRPCCIQMHGQCRITTPDYCEFVRGHYHANATLCSQVSCLNSVCGMTPFLSADRPDQIYRLLTPLFMHAGIIRCAISVVLQMKIMRNFEVMIGWLRLSIIYFVSGIGGYLASAVFVPYMPEVGPAGSQGGVLGALIVNVLYNWHFLRRPARTLVYHLAIAAALFVTGLLPFVDNWAQLFGFLFGSLLAAALIPYIVFGRRDAAAQRRRRFAIVSVSLAATTLMFTVLLVMFYGLPATSFAAYNILHLVNCPFSGKVCEQQGLFLRSWLPI